MSWTLKDLEEQLLIGSTLVEGSTLSEDEARAVLAGKTVSGHPVQELRELINYRAATEWLLAQFAASPYASRDLITGFHQRLMAGVSDVAGQLKVYANFTIRTDGTRHPFLAPSEVDEALREWLEDFNHGPSQPAAARAAALYARFEHIHPFDDGNGRVGRILLAWWLRWKGQLRWRFTASDKVEHLRAIEASNRGSLADLEKFFEERIRPEAL